jgi:hypothetical protein
MKQAMIHPFILSHQESGESFSLKRKCLRICLLLMMGFLSMPSIAQDSIPEHLRLCVNFSQAEISLHHRVVRGPQGQKYYRWATDYMVMNEMERMDEKKYFDSCYTAVCKEITLAENQASTLPEFRIKLLPSSKEYYRKMLLFIEQVDRGIWPYSEQFIEQYCQP